MFFQIEAGELCKSDMVTVSGRMLLIHKMVGTLSVMSLRIAIWAHQWQKHILFSGHTQSVLPTTIYNMRYKHRAQNKKKYQNSPFNWTNAVESIVVQQLVLQAFNKYYWPHGCSVEALLLSCQTSNSVCKHGLVTVLKCSPIIVIYVLNYFCMRKYLNPSSLSQKIRCRTSYMSYMLEPMALYRA